MSPTRRMKPIELVEEWIRRFNAADVEGLAALYAIDAVNHQVVTEPLIGREAIRNMFRIEFARATMVCRKENLFECGDWAILEWSDPLGLRGCGFFQVKTDLIVFQRGYFDQLSFFRVQGLPVPEHYLGQRKPPSSLTSVKEEIIALEKVLFEKVVRSSKARLLELLSPNFREIGASGNCFGLDEVLNDLPTEEGWSIKAVDFQFHQLADDFAQLTYRAHIKHSEMDGGVFSIRNSFWKRHADQWKMEFHQATKTAPFDLASL